jgi:hypothetical protein
MRSKSFAVAAALAALALPAAASAASEIYAGTTSNGGEVAMDVKVDRHGTPRKVTEIRANHLPTTCEQSGPVANSSFRVPVAIKVVHGKFEFENTDDYGNHRSVSGKFKGNKLQKASGDFVYAAHYPATDQYPEENCSTGEQTFSMKRGAPDVVPGGPRLLP